MLLRLSRVPGTEHGLDKHELLPLESAALAAPLLQGAGAMGGYSGGGWWEGRRPTAWPNSAAAAQTPAPAGAWPSGVPGPAAKLEAEDAVLLGSTKTSHRLCGGGHRRPNAVISCHREEGLARLYTEPS